MLVLFLFFDGQHVGDAFDIEIGLDGGRSRPRYPAFRPDGLCKKSFYIDTMYIMYYNYAPLSAPPDWHY